DGRETSVVESFISSGGFLLASEPCWTLLSNRGNTRLHIMSLFLRGPKRSSLLVDSNKMCLRVSLKCPASVLCLLVEVAWACGRRRPVVSGERLSATIYQRDNSSGTRRPNGQTVLELGKTKRHIN
ncbi:hypothetical protein SK128_012890, partial [Halocaridina rubra]